MEKKSNFYLFRRKRKDGKGYEYIQHIVSVSIDRGLSCSCSPEFAWRGLNRLDVEKMRFLISISEYRNSVWELVIYNMETEQHSWALIPKNEQYEDLLRGKKLTRLSDKEQEELEDFKQKINKIWKKEITPTKETPMQY